MLVGIDREVADVARAGGHDHVFVYWPAWAVPVAVYFQSSPGSSRPFWFVSPVLKPLTRRVRD